MLKHKTIFCQSASTKRFGNRKNNGSHSVARRLNATAGEAHCHSHLPAVVGEGIGYRRGCRHSSLRSGRRRTDCAGGCHNCQVRHGIHLGEDHSFLPGRHNQPAGRIPVHRGDPSHWIRSVHQTQLERHSPGVESSQNSLKLAVLSTFPKARTKVNLLSLPMSSTEIKFLLMVHLLVSHVPFATLKIFN